MATKLRSGIFLAPFHPLDEDPTLCLQRDFELIEYVERLGYEEAWVGEHHSGGYEIIASPELFIAAAAERTHRIMLGTGVVSLPYHNPLMTADRMIQLDHQTRGRVMFGIGPGLLPSDAFQLGIPPSKQRDRMAESIDVILRLLRGERVTLKTEWFELVDAMCQLRPYSLPHPEIAVASSVTPSGGKLAGKYGFGMLCVAATQSSGFDALAVNWKIANEVASESGREMDPARLRLVGPVHLAETQAQAMANVKFGFEKWSDYFARINPMAGPAQAARPIDEVIQGAIESGSVVIGTPDDAVAQIRRLQEKQGAFGCFLHLAHNWADFEATKKSYELWQRHVMPVIHGSNTSRQQAFDWATDAENAGRFMSAAATAAKQAFKAHYGEQKRD